MHDKNAKLAYLQVLFEEKGEDQFVALLDASLSRISRQRGWSSREKFLDRFGVRGKLRKCVLTSQRMMRRDETTGQLKLVEKLVDLLDILDTIGSGVEEVFSGGGVEDYFPWNILDRGNRIEIAFPKYASCLLHDDNRPALTSTVDWHDYDAWEELRRFFVTGDSFSVTPRLVPTSIDPSNERSIDQLRQEYDNLFNENVEPTLKPDGTERKVSPTRTLGAVIVLGSPGANMFADFVAGEIMDDCAPTIADDLLVQYPFNHNAASSMLFADAKKRCVVFKGQEYHNAVHKSRQTAYGLILVDARCVPLKVLCCGIGRWGTRGAAKALLEHIWEPERLMAMLVKVDAPAPKDDHAPTDDFKWEMVDDVMQLPCPQPTV